MKGTLVNVLVIIIGSLLGNLLKSRFPKGMKDRIMEGMGLFVVVIGLKMAFVDDRFLLIILSIIPGAILGEILKIQENLNQLGSLLEERFNRGGDNFTQGFLRASILFCVGAMAIMGSIQEGLTGDPGILYAKSVLDGVSSIAFASSMGLGVAFSALPVFLYQGSITLMASLVESYLSIKALDLMTATGGLLIVGIGINMLGLGVIKVGNLLPAIFFALLLGHYF